MTTATNLPTVTVGKLRAVKASIKGPTSVTVFDDASDPRTAVWSAPDLDSALADMRALDVYLRALDIHRAKLTQENVDRVQDALFGLPERLFDLALKIAHARGVF
jgi:hypothetical protein